MGKKDSLVVGLDIGTTKICTVVGEVVDGQVNIIGLGTHPSKGLRKGSLRRSSGTIFGNTTNAVGASTLRSRRQRPQGSPVVSNKGFRENSPRRCGVTVYRNARFSPARRLIA